MSSGMIYKNAENSARNSRQTKSKFTEWNLATKTQDTKEQSEKMNKISQIKLNSKTSSIINKNHTINDTLTEVNSNDINENSKPVFKTNKKNLQTKLSFGTLPIIDERTDKIDADNNFTEAYTGDTNQNSSRAVGKIILLPNAKSEVEIDSDKKKSRRPAGMLGTFNNQQKGIVTRLRRSLDKKSNHVGFAEEVPSSEKFYRHPNLSYEEQQKRLNDSYKAEGANFGSAMSKRILDAPNLPSAKTTIKASSKGSKEYDYVPVISTRNDTKNLRMSNGNRTGQNHAKEYNKNNWGAQLEMHKNVEGMKNDKGIETGNMGNRNIKNRNIENNRSVVNETVRDMSKLQSSIKQQRGEKGYINIRDHQKNVENTTSSDAISDYDPNKIPYVDVPDYSDIREESLDKADRKANNQKTEDKDIDAVDPQISINLKESSKSSANDTESKKASLKDKLEDSNKTTNEGKNTGFPNLEKPSNTDKSYENKDDKPLKTLNHYPVIKDDSNLPDFKLHEKFKVPSDFSKFDALKGGEHEENNKDKVSDNGNNLNNFSLKEGSKSKETSEENSESREESKETQPEGDYSGRQLGPIIFDINEYRKPFDLDEFLKDDPIMKKLKLLEKETRTKYGQNGKRVPGDFNESESDNSFRERINGPGDSTEVQHTFSDSAKSHLSSDFINIFAKMDPRSQHRSQEQSEMNEDTENREDLTMLDQEIHDKPMKPNNMNEDTKNRDDSNEETSDEDFLKFVFEKNKKIDLPARSQGEEEFLAKYFTDAVIRNLHQEANVDRDRKRKDDERKEDTYNALSTILGKKSHVSRLDEEIDGKIKAQEDEPVIYKNFWSLDYKSPRKRVDMEAQERRK